MPPPKAELRRQQQARESGLRVRRRKTSSRSFSRDGNGEEDAAAAGGKTERRFAYGEGRRIGGFAGEGRLKNPPPLPRLPREKTAEAGCAEGGGEQRMLLLLLLLLAWGRPSPALGGSGHAVSAGSRLPACLASACAGTRLGRVAGCGDWLAGAGQVPRDWRAPQSGRRWRGS